MARRPITDAEKREAVRKGEEEARRRYPGRDFSIQVDNMTDERGEITYKVMLADDGRDPLSR